MNIAVIGLGRMGNALAQRMVQGGHTVYGYDQSAAACDAAAEVGVQVCADIPALFVDTALDAVWLMVPVGDPVDQVLKELIPLMQPGIICIDGGNSLYTDSMRRAQQLAQHGIAYLDCGTSGGIRGREHGFCLMVGGELAAYERVVPVLQSVAAPGGYGYMGPSGTGHYVKMVHNGIEYALLQAYAEGCAIIKNGTFKDEQLDLAKITDVWQHGSVIRSFLLELMQEVFETDQDFKDIGGQVAEGGTGLWTHQEAQAQEIDAPALAAALAVRKASRETGGDFATKLIALTRQKFGGHAVQRSSNPSTSSGRTG